MRRTNLTSWALEWWRPIVGWTPVADYPLEASRGNYSILEAIPDPRYTIGATPIDYQVWYDRVPTVNGVTLVSEREYAQMERDWNLDPNERYYTYPDTDVPITWTERCPKRVEIAYFIS